MFVLDYQDKSVDESFSVENLINEISGLCPMLKQL